MFISPFDLKFVFMATVTWQSALDGLNKKAGSNYSLDDFKSANRGLYTDDDYLSEIEQYKGQPYYDYLLRNPWLAGNVSEFSPTFGQSFMEGLFGDTSARDRYYAEMRSNRTQWLSDALERFRQEDYNSAEQQAARQRDAGLNPDLAPGSVTAGSAAENDQPMQPINWPSGSDASKAVTTIGDLSLRFVSQVMGLAQSFQSLKLGNQSLVSGEIANNEKARDFVLNQIAGTSFFNSENDIDNISDSDLANNILSAASKIDYGVYSRSTGKLIRRMFNRYSKDVASGRSPMAVEELKAALRDKIVNRNKSAIGAASSPLFDEDFNKWLRNVSEIFGKYEYRAQVAEYNFRLAKAGYDTKYFHSLDPELHAKAANKQAEAASTSSEAEALTEGMWTEIYKLCKESNSWYGTLGLLLIPYLRTLGSTLVSGGLNLRGMIQTENKNYNSTTKNINNW